MAVRNRLLQLVILSVAAASRSEAAAESKDLCNPRPLHQTGTEISAEAVVGEGQNQRERWGKFRLSSNFPRIFSLNLNTLLSKYQGNQGYA